MVTIINFADDYSSHLSKNFYLPLKRIFHCSDQLMSLTPRGQRVNLIHFQVLNTHSFGITKDAGSLMIIISNA